MSAHAARAVRERRERQKHFILVKKRNVEEDEESGAFAQHDEVPQALSDGCFLPRAKCPWLCALLGFALIALGAAQCYFAFYANSYAAAADSAGDESPPEPRNRTALGDGAALKQFLRTLAYVGPTVVGTGAFLITVSCVIIFEGRDRIIKAMRNKEVERTSKNKEFIYNAVMKRFVNEVAEKSSARGAAQGGLSQQRAAAAAGIDPQALKASSSSFSAAAGAPSAPPHSDVTTLLMKERSGRQGAVADANAVALMSESDSVKKENAAERPKCGRVPTVIT